MSDSDRKRAALATFLGEDRDITPCRDDASRFEVGQREYLVLTDSEATARALADARESLWAFRSDFWGRYTALSERAIAAVSKHIAALCENAGPVVEALVGPRLDEMLADAVKTDGRAHFLAGYDGAENEVGTGADTLYIYRVN